MNSLRKYKNQVLDMLPCSKQEKAYCLKEIDRSLGANAETLSYEDIIERIGTPEELAASSIQGMDARGIAQAMKSRNRLKRLAVILAAIILLIWLLVMIIIIIDNNNHRIDHVIEEPISTWDYTPIQEGETRQ